jgi:protein O-GlcNAc transferase
MRVADWPRADGLAGPLSAHIAGGNFVDPFVTLAFGLHPLEQLKSASRYVRTRIPEAPKPFIHSTAVPVDRLRIAYLSSDFRQHPVGVTIAELLERHDKTGFELIGVSYGANDASGTRARIVKAFDQFHDVVSDTDRHVATLLNDLQVHIVVALNGLTGGCRPGVLAYRPAPIQVSYLGYAGTTGADFIDYILADETVLPFDQQPFFTERIVQLPGCYHANDTTRHISPQSPTRSELGLPDRGLIFCCFNQSYKIAAPVFDVWMRLLAQIPGGVLWLTKMDDLTHANLRREAAARGIDPDRLIFAPRIDSGADHLARQRAADLFLDTLPYNAHATAGDALWAGLPVITCAGTAFASRVGASMLKAAGLPELVTHSLEDYEALALKLATDPALLQSIRRKLADNRRTCPLFDGDRFRRHIEAAYTAMWNIYRRGESPRSFRVEPNATTSGALN